MALYWKQWAWQVVVVVDELRRVGQRETAQVLASSASVGHRFLAVQGGIGNMTGQLIKIFPSMMCDVTVIIPEPLPTPEQERTGAWQSTVDTGEEEQRLRDLILCAGALSSSRAQVAASTADDGRDATTSKSWNAKNSASDGMRMVVLDGWPCRHARYVAWCF